MTDDRGPADMSFPNDADDADGAPVDASPEYLAMLRRVAGPVPTSEVDWVGFHARLNARAELALARLRPPVARGGVVRARAGAPRRAASWWEYAALPGHVWRPIAAAAGIAIAAGVHALSSDSLEVDASGMVSMATSDIASAQGAFESAVTGGESSGTIATYLVPSSAEAARAASGDTSTAK